MFDTEMIAFLMNEVHWLAINDCDTAQKANT